MRQLGRWAKKQYDVPVRHFPGPDDIVVVLAIIVLCWFLFRMF